jgi:hypothetical protein
VSLPSILIPRQTIEVEGEEVKIRGLTRAEAAEFQKMVRDGKSMADIEIAVLAAGTDTSREETKAWYATAPQHVVDPIIDAIKDISRFSEGAQKSGGEGDRPGGG